MCYNLGANESYSTPALQQAYMPADEFDATVYGDLFQWGREADGHEKRNSATTSELATSNKPGHSNFISNNSNPYDWRSGGGNDTRWNGATEDPCPGGFRVPSKAQWESITGGSYFSSSVPVNKSGNLWTWKATNTSGWQIGDFLFLPAAGCRYSGSASLGGQGSDGSYWSSTVSGAYAHGLGFDSSNVAPANGDDRAYGFSVRCVVD
jgi:uncharacterized protein (TIGR02145 family)